MTTDADIARLVLASYAYPGGPSVTWDVIYHGAPEDDISCYLKRRDGICFVIIPGTTDIPGWRRDFQAWPTEMDGHSELGELHYGFTKGLPDLVTWVIANTAPDELLALGSHSKGAGHCPIAAGLLTIAGRKVIRYVMFAPPRPGFARLGEWLLANQIRGMGYDNFPDGVCDVPFTLPGVPFSHTVPLLAINVPPAPNDPWRIFGMARHHMQLYAQAPELAAYLVAP